MKTNAVLGGLLGLQILLVAATHWAGGAATVAAHKLVEVERADITTLTIASPAAEGKAEEPVKLAKKSGQWVIASSEDYPADSKKVDDILDKLLAIQTRQPIASTKVSHTGLSVDEKDFDKRVEVAAGDKQTVIFLGTGSAKSANVRKSGEDDVYSADGLSAWSIASTPRSYYEPMYVDVEAATLSTLDLRYADHTLSLRKDGEAWTADGLPPERMLDADAVKKLVDKAAQVRIADLPKPGEPHTFDGGVRVDWTIEDNGQNVTGGYAIGLPEGGRRPVKSHGSEHVVLATEGSLDPVLSATLEGLLTAPAVP